jgi:peptidyl-prolyl cis-trans isomerase B (cyclophilin B)
MKKIITMIGIMICLSLVVGCQKEDNENVSEFKSDQFAEPTPGETVAEIKVKDYGSIYVKFFDEAAPKAVENFITHAKNGYYDGLTFHRIIEDFMIQGGDPTGTGSGGESIWGENFEDEFAVGLQPFRGALCMANSGKNTNGSQFFLVQSELTYSKEELEEMESYYGTDYDDKAEELYGEIGGTPWLYQMHTVFGQIYEGYEVLDAIAKVDKTDVKNGVPAFDVIIETIIIFDYE